jgi:hypothetical protein
MAAAAKQQQISHTIDAGMSATEHMGDRTATKQCGTQHDQSGAAQACEH